MFGPMMFRGHALERRLGARFLLRVKRRRVHAAHPRKRRQIKAMLCASPSFRKIKLGCAAAVRAASESDLHAALRHIRRIA